MPSAGASYSITRDLLAFLRAHREPEHTSLPGAPPLRTEAEPGRTGERELVKGCRSLMSVAEEVAAHPSRGNTACGLNPSGGLPQSIAG